MLRFLFGWKLLLCLLFCYPKLQILAQQAGTLIHCHLTITGFFIGVEGEMSCDDEI